MSEPIHKLSTMLALAMNVSDGPYDVIIARKGTGSLVHQTITKKDLADLIEEDPEVLAVDIDRRVSARRMNRGAGRRTS